LKKRKNRRWVVAKAELGDSLERQCIAEPAPEKSRSAIQCGFDLATRSAAAVTRGDEPDASARAVARQLDQGDARPFEARVTDFIIENRIQFFAKQLFEPLAAKAKVSSGAVPRPFVLGHGTFLAASARAEAAENQWFWMVSAYAATTETITK
jgi:hypothetical protein